MNAKRHSSLKRNKKIKQKVVRKLKAWHRRLGVFCSVFLILITVTGIAINHTDSLSLAKTPVTQNWLLNYYGIKSTNTVYSSKHDSNQLVFSNNLLWLNKSLILKADKQIHYAFVYQNLIIAATSGQLYLLNKSGELQETQDSTFSLPTPINKLGLDAVHSLWIESNQKNYIADKDIIDWQESTPNSKVHWVSSVKSVQQDDLNLVRSQYLDWQRIMLDLHSGRIFGVSGTTFWDLISIILLFLAFSGLVIYIKQKPSKK